MEEQVTESKIAATKRLTAEGSWDEACSFRDEVRQKLRAEGQTRAQAREGAWEAMLEAFPPPEPDSESDISFVVPPEWDSRSSSEDYVPAILWTLNNLDNEEVQPAGAPGPGAWSMLTWAKQYRNAFFEKVLPRALTVKPKDPGAGKAEQDWGPRPSDEEVRALLEEIVAKASKPYICPACGHEIPVDGEDGNEP